VNIKKISTNVIIIGIFLFTVISLVSLFNGIHINSLKFKNVLLKNINLKIENKIVLKISRIDIKYTPSTKKFKLNGNFFKLLKIINFFQLVKIDRIRYRNNDYAILLKKNVFTVNSDNVNAKIVIFPKKSEILVQMLKTPYFLLQNTIVIPKKTGIEIKGNINENKFNAFLSHKGFLRSYFKTLKYTYKKTDLFAKNLHIILDLNNLNPDIQSSYLNVKYEDYRVKAYDTSLTKHNRRIHLKAKRLIVSQPQIKAWFINIKATYFPKTGFIIATSKNSAYIYDKAHIKASGVQLIFKNKNDFNLYAKKIDANYHKFSVSAYREYLNVFDAHFFYALNQLNISSKNITLQSADIQGKDYNLELPYVKGKIFGFDAFATDIQANVKNKTAKIKKASYNNVNVHDVTLRNYTVTFYSEATFQNNIKTLLKKFLHIQIPLTQIKGKNQIFGKINLKKLSVNVKIKTLFSEFKLFAFKLLIPVGEVFITEKNIKIKTANSSFVINKFLKLNFEANALYDYKQNLFNIDALINFKIDKLINLKNYKEKITIDLNNQILKCKNSKLAINFYYKNLIISPLKNLLKYSYLKHFVKDGILLIRFGKKIDIISYVLLNQPILYPHSLKKVTSKLKPLSKIYIYILVNKKIFFYNDHINVLIDDNKINANLHGIDINLYPLEKYLNLDDNQTKTTDMSITLNTTNTNLIYKTHKFLSQKAEFSYKNGKLKFYSKYKQSSIEGYSKQNYIFIEGKHFLKEEYDAFLPNLDFFSKIDLDFVTVKSPDDFYTGKVFINYAIVKDLKALNNIIAFINTLPSLLTFSSPGFSSKGYKIKSGFISYLIYNKVLYVKKAVIKGHNLDFSAKGYVDFNKNYIFLKVTAKLKIKLKKIPIIGKGISYILFGKDGNLDIKLTVKGDINDPKVKEDLGKDILLSPFKLFKRVLTLPFHLF